MTDEPSCVIGESRFHASVNCPSTPHLFSVAAGCNVQNYTDPVTMEHCRLAGLLDLNQTNPAVAHGEFAAFEMARPAAASPA